jgi:hypothetical protein
MLGPRLARMKKAIGNKAKVSMPPAIRSIRRRICFGTEQEIPDVELGNRERLR